MSAMDVEKTMQFILDAQAATSVQLDRLTEIVAGNHASQAARNAELSTQIAAQKDHLDQFSNLMMTWVERHDKRMDQLAERQNRTDEKVAQTTENLNALIKVVDGLVRRDNGNVH